MRSFLAVLTAIAILFAVGCSGSDNNQPSEATEEAPHILAVQNAKMGHLTVQGDTYSLTLTGVDDKTVWFTDRPVHDAGAEPTRDLLDKLLDSNEGPPNAAMVWASDDGETTLILELLSAKYDEALGTIVYQARVLDQGDGKLAEFGSSAKVPDGEIAEPALFIDSIFKDEVCELDLYNEVHNPPGEFGYVPEFNVYLVPDDETNKDSGPDGVPTIESKTSLSWKWEADSSIDDCSVYVTLEEASSSTDVISFELYNGSTGRQSAQLRRLRWIRLLLDNAYELGDLPHGLLRL
jgi:hypothetical protein